MNWYKSIKIALAEVLDIGKIQSKPVESISNGDYGAWLSATGAYIPVPWMGHFDIAKQILTANGDIKDRDDIKNTNPQYCYKKLFELGYARIVFEDLSSYVSYYKLTSSQKRALIKIFKTYRTYEINCTNELSKQTVTIDSNKLQYFETIL